MPKNNAVNLVTGSTGYIGSYVADRLPNVYRVKREEFDDPNLKGDHLICLHGAAEMSPFLLQSEASERKIFEANYFSVTRIVRNVGRHMVAQRYGKIIICSSIIANIPTQGEAVYGASKAAINYFIKTIKLELDKFGIGVFGLAPGPIFDSPMMRGVKTDLEPTMIEEVWATIKKLLKD